MQSQDEEGQNNKLSYEVSISIKYTLYVIDTNDLSLTSDAAYCYLLVVI